MSQAKVDRYKEEKRNRAKIMARQKREWMITKICGAVLGVAIVGWAGYSVYETVTGPDASTENTFTETEGYTVNTDALSTYLDSLQND